ncbi:MAG: aminotransferase class V-fold PLP-dependent enzyme [Firmicutes bacterium]|jgi:glutamate/tyrosine decarboxylase-like PLP-dependent enzyme|nr:aminotransferase class V-fold PLP-dependent enzyme [Bacillota bacterium]
MSKYYISPILEKIRKSSLSNDLQYAHEAAIDYIDKLDGRSVFPSESSIKNLSIFDEELDNKPCSGKEVLDLLHNYGSPATVTQTSGRYFGFVVGGILPSALTSKWLTDVWDQNSAMYVMSPVAAKIEEVTEKWLVDILDLPEETVAGFVNGSSTAITIGLNTGRNYVYNNLGYDVIRDGLSGAPKIKIIVGEDAHSTVYKALSILGLGNDNLVKVPVDDQGRMLADKMPELDKSTLLVLQAGNVNTGSFDPFDKICKKAKDAGAYIHIDGAFGLWANACDKLKHLTKGMEYADSWSTDGHKTLNVPYDSGIVFSRHRDMLVNSMHMTGSYIILSDQRDSMLYTSDMSRRARAIDVWATLKGLGRDGVNELVYELHQKAVYFGDLLREAGLEILNDIVFNQLLVRYESDEKTEKLISEVQKSGVCWLGGAKHKGKSVMRISVSSYKTTYEDVKMSAEDIIRIAKTL